jgi:hypothetical protein
LQRAAKPTDPASDPRGIICPKVDYTCIYNAAERTPTMSDAWFNENRIQLLSSLDTLVAEARTNAAHLKDAQQIQSLVHQAEQHYAATEAALRNLSEQRQALLETLEQLQTELAVAGRPITGEIS